MTRKKKAREWKNVHVHEGEIHSGSCMYIIKERITVREVLRPARRPRRGK